MYSDKLYHHGIKGQKWGQRRYQYKDGSYTQEGKDRRNSGIVKSGHDNSNHNYRIRKSNKKEDIKKKKLSPEERKERNKKIALITAGTVAAVGITAYSIHHKKQIDAGRKLTEAMLQQLNKSDALEKQLHTTLNKANRNKDYRYSKEIQDHINNNYKKRAIAQNNYNELMKNKHNSKYINKKYGTSVATNKKLTATMQSEISRHESINTHLVKKLEKAKEIGDKSYIYSLQQKIDRNNQKYNIAKNTYNELMTNKHNAGYINKNASKLIANGKMRMR